MNDFFPRLKKAIGDFGEIPEYVQKTLEDLSGKGIDIDLDNFYTTNFGLFTLKDGVLYSYAVYITDKDYDRDNNIKEYTLERIKQEKEQKSFVENLHKVHLINCKSLKKAKNEGRVDKYKGTHRKGGKYFYRFIKDNEVVLEEKNQKLRMCINCVDGVNKEYDKKFDPHNFPMIEYLKLSINNTKKLITDCYAEYSSPNVYSDDFKKISKQYRESVGKECEDYDCPYGGGPFDLRFLHTHHKNMDKTDNSYINLEALCIYCHSERPNHQHLKRTADYNDFIRSEQTKRAKQHRAG